VYAQGEVAPPITLPQVTQQQVIAACAAEGATEANCKAVIAAYFAYLKATGVTGAPLEQAIADLVVALAETPNASPELQAVIVAAINDIGSNYATGEQSVAILAIAETVASGQVQTGTVIVPVPSSPT
jgi:hypothetical protein